MGILLLIDFYSIRAMEYDYMIQLYNVLEVSKYGY